MNTTTESYAFDLPKRHKAATSPPSEAEWAVRRDLAAAYRLCALFGWDDLIYTHLSARVPGPEHHFLVNPLGLGFDEITASNLVKIDLEGNIIGDSPYTPNAAGFVIHGGIHANREDAQCIIHLHTEAGMALSCLEEGLLPITQHALRFLGRLGYHAFEGIALGVGERERLIQALGSAPALILRNHGTLTVGPSVGHAFVEMFYLEKAARAQLLAQATGKQLTFPDAVTAGKTVEQWVSNLVGQSSREWPALVRKLDKIDPSYAD
jgi:ribulose-5-phosphate 4-epimerase/fuculose-1-phosphate aldolase